MRFLPCALIIVTAIVFHAPAATATQQGEAPEDARQYVTYSPYPEYPYIARRERWEGAGLYRLSIDRQAGVVTKIQVLQTTGYKVLDSVAIKALQKWRFRTPIPFHGVRIPVRFELTKGNSFGLERIRGNAIYSPVPPYPAGAWRQNIGGSGRFEVMVDFEKGKVQDVKILQTTGDARLDRSVTSTFRKWRFRPHTTHSFKMPFNFY